MNGAARISPGPTIYEGRYWLVEHAYPTALKGWLVIVLRRHAEALHELSAEECLELGELQGKTARLLHQQTGCQKEYMVFFAEQPGFAHIHFHVVPRAVEWPEALKGGKSFALLKVSEAEAVAPEEVRQFCIELQQRFAAR